MKKIIFVLSLVLVFLSCKKSSGDGISPFDGQLSKRYVASLVGIEEQREEILAKSNLSMVDFTRISTDSAWSLPAAEQTKLSAVRSSILMPSNLSLLQKVIPLEDISIYMNNIYGGTVGGFVSLAPDMKRISTMYDTYWALRLDYDGTKFRPDGAGYAVIRFYSDVASTLAIPFCAELGGTQPCAWPNTGGGFTSSTLGSGGYPEYVFKSYSAPRAGAELYEVTPLGREILRSTFVEGKGWQTNEIGFVAPYSVSVCNGVFSTKSGRVLITTYALCDGREYIVRGKVGAEYDLTTQTRYEGVQLEVVEKGVYGIRVTESQLESVWQDTVALY